MLKIIRNPLYIYVLGFALTFLVYSLGWSDLYPELSIGMKGFLITTFVFFMTFGIILNKLKLIKKTYSKTKPQLIYNLFYFLIFLYFIEFVHEKDIPLLSKLVGRMGVSYMEFGIPLLHGILISFNSFLIAHAFSIYMSTKKKKVLCYYILLYMPPLLFLSRSIIVMGLLTSLFIYLHYVKKIKIKTYLILSISILVGLYFFGVIGNLRSGGDYIYTQSKAKDSFMESAMPVEYYWTYLYVASPLANFQNTVSKKKIKDYSLKGYIYYENMPKIISKNLREFVSIEERDLERIVPWLTVGTTYAKSFSYLGWFGPYIMFFTNLAIYLFVIIFFVPRKSSYHITTIAILSIIILLNIFSNILIVTGISFQLIYCVLFAFFENKKIVIRK